MKKTKIILLLLIFILVLTGCTKKSSTCEKFASALKEQGYEVYDYTQGYGYANKAYQSSSDDYMALFVEGKNLKDIQGIFIDEVKNIYGLAGVKTKEEQEQSEDKGPIPIVKGGDSWESVEVTTDNSFYYISYINDTLLYIKSNTDNEAKFRKIIDTIKY